MADSKASTKARLVRTPSAIATAAICGKVSGISTEACTHLEQINEGVAPSADGCEECLKIGSPWVHLRLCLTCGHVGCCDSSPNRHATKHFHSTGHPIIRSFQPGEDWAWCYLDEVFLS